MIRRGNRTRHGARPGAPANVPLAPHARVRGPHPRRRRRRRVRTPPRSRLARRTFRDGPVIPRQKTLTRGRGRFEMDRLMDVVDRWGAGMTRFGKRDESLLDLMAEAALAALDRCRDRAAGRDRRRRHEPRGVHGRRQLRLAGRARTSGFPGAGLRVETATSSGVAAVYAASRPSRPGCTGRCSWSAARR